MQNIVQYLKEVVERGGSDLHIVANAPPMMRLNGELVRIERNVLSKNDTMELLSEILTPEQMEILEERKSLDLAYEVLHAGVVQRFRCNFFFQREGLDGAFRVIPREIPTLRELNLPQSLEDLARYRDGLILITGPTGSGKSTTITALIDIINKTQARHIVTIEDPIEHVHVNKLSLIHQRQIGLHSLSFESSLKAVLHQDCDVVMVGEMRDLETIELTLTAAGTGHLVFSTMHTSSAAKAVERLIEFYPAQRQMSVRAMLADCMRAVVAQQLLPRADGWGRIPAVEILINCLPIANLIREFKTHQVTFVMQTSKNIGMITMDDYLRQLFEEGKITSVTAYEHAIDKKSMESVLQPGGR